MTDIEVSGTMDEGTARKFTNDLKHLFKILDRAYDVMIEGRPWVALGYPSMAAWWEGEGLSSVRLTVEARHAVVSAMDDEGTSQSAIATVTGLSRRTVQRALKKDAKVVTSTDGQKSTPTTSTEDIDTFEQYRKELFFNIDQLMKDSKIHERRLLELLQNRMRGVHSKLGLPRID
jgi:predicted DNA-binding protein (UPF0251 family)